MYYIASQIVSRIEPPIVTVVHSAFRACVEDARYSAQVVPPTAQDSHEGAAVAIIKNISQMPRAMALYGDLIVTRDVAEELGKVALFERRAVVITQAFSYPFSPGDMSYEQSPAYGGKSTIDSLTARFVKLYKRAVPAHDYVCLCPIRPRNYANGKFKDSIEEMRVNTGGRMGLSSGWHDFSWPALQECGMFSDGVLFLHERAWAVLERHLTEPYWVTRDVGDDIRYID